ncbi:MAG: LemA family protein, partial [Nitrospiraceae bacterium]|nr:LemA family protein [Nitrospiraceae bacterium]
MAGLVLIAAIALFFLWMVFIYNRLVRLRNDVRSAWSQIDVQLKRRHDLIPNLVAAVKGYMAFERETLQKVAEARARAVGAAGLREKAAANY